LSCIKLELLEKVRVLSTALDNDNRKPMRV